MKTRYLIPIFFVFLSFFSSAQEQTIQLKLEEGHVYVFEKVDKIYGTREDDSREIYSTREKTVRIFVEKFVAGQEAVVSAHLLTDTYDRPTSLPLISKIDFVYPDFNPDKLTTSSKDLFDMFLCRDEIKFSIDLKSREIKVFDRVELLENFLSYLETQDLDENDIKSIIENTNKNILPEQKYLVSHLLWFHNSKIEADNSIENSLIKDKLKINKKGKDFLAFSDMDFDNLIPGKTYKKYWVETDNGIITNYSTIQRDSVKDSYEVRINKMIWRVNETNFSLLYAKPLPKNQLVISGEIETPLSNIMHIRILDKPCGVEMREKTVLLDEKGYFKTMVDFSHGGFVYVENENRNKHRPPKTFVFYAEPGDTLEFKANGKEQPWNISYSGTRIAESELIEEIRKNILVNTDTSRSSRSRVIFDNDLMFAYNIINNKIYGSAEKVQNIFSELNNVEKITSKYKLNIDEHVLNFILNETKSYIYSGLFNFFITFNQRRIAGLIKDKDGNIVVSFSHDMNIPDFKEVRSSLNQTNILNFYNDYGLYSRKMVENYFMYEFAKVNKIDNRRIVTSGMRFPSDIDNRIQFMRLILTGPALYREIASVLSSILIRNERIYFYIDRDEYSVNTALDKIELLSKRCNNMNLVSTMEDIVKQHQKLQNDNFLPNLTFLNIDKKKVTFKDFAGSKPTLFCIAEGWGHNRYHFDDLAKENPDINFVLVCENTSFANWKDYTKRAEPIAKQLLFVDDSTTVRDVFQKPYVYFVLDKNGNMAGNVRSAEEGIKKARTTVEPKKKQLNKSQLKIIISILLVSLLTLFIIMLYWKWRVRQRFRKEEQKRRLRELELTAIRSQMNPHFLFNSLNSVQNLVQQNKGREAHLYLADFAGLIRKVLQNSEKEEVSLAEELEMVKQYLSLEKLRFDFDYSVSVDENIDANNTMVPSMLLQPFAENAVIHGLQNKTGNRQLKIEVTREETGIKISIEDNGIGREAAKEISKTKNGKGSKLMKERLEILQQKQSENYRLEIIDINKDGETGTLVEIFIPEEK
ncbi:MAG TPA: histidine kinase [Draconibacterium sp.]|nr:histidine kinase [Draconibacterium sp.]